VYHIRLLIDQPTHLTKHAVVRFSINILNSIASCLPYSTLLRSCKLPEITTFTMVPCRRMIRVRPRQQRSYYEDKDKDWDERQPLLAYAKDVTVPYNRSTLPSRVTRTSAQHRSAKSPSEHSDGLAEARHSVEARARKDAATRACARGTSSSQRDYPSGPSSSRFPSERDETRHLRRRHFKVARITTRIVTVEENGAHTAV
jgi:hypothetical protein